MALYVDSFQPLLKIISDEISIKHNIVLKGLALFGLFYVTKKSAQLGYELISSFKTYAVSRIFKKSLKESGDWAVVIICDELGSEFAYLLAEQEINLILIDHHPRIHELQITLENRFKIKCEKILFSTSDVQLAAHDLVVHSMGKNCCALG
ncbi:hypothetical protein HELRODRAFT_180725 [Helobdella robusta]|uniref:RCK N-terminal domain-containing protein n=1 Tax=Helobdella robusta TaxID=6412 RepID=T1FG74_HELRO|nr:hypothetical protein HELRODRAFT_180725 [Helobdella robusta]ESN93633.1 hypothetical protein HELRODRAFT_180725 [Helobdella robusta]